MNDLEKDKLKLLLEIVAEMTYSNIIILSFQNPYMDRGA